MFKMSIVVEVPCFTFLPMNSQPWLPHLDALEKGILRVMIVEKQWMLLMMRRISCFVIIVINHDILKRLVGGYMVALLEVEEVVLVVLSSLGLITL